MVSSASATIAFASWTGAVVSGIVGLLLDRDSVRHAGTPDCCAVELGDPGGHELTEVLLVHLQDPGGVAVEVVHVVGAGEENVRRSAVAVFVAVLIELGD